VSPDPESGKPAESRADLSDPAKPPPAILPRRGVRGAAENIGETHIYTGEHFTLGMKLAASIWGSEGSFYFLAPRGAANRHARRFRLTQKGWNQMWRQFAAEDPSGALAYKEKLRGQAVEEQPAAEQAAAFARQGEPSRSPASQDPLDRLERLAALHRQGALTDDEFQAAKSELLKRL